ncbi:hypothetical protein Ciccas_013001, partial [Cichlidogyrus casuarinus]
YSAIPSDTEIVLCNSTLSRFERTCDLGMLCKPCVTTSISASPLLSKAIRTFVSSFTSPKARVIAYKTVILGRLLTHCCTFATVTRQDAMKIERVQKLLIRSLRKLPYSESLNEASLCPL